MTDKPTPTDTPPPCDQELFDQGVSVGLFDIPKWTAEALCRGIAAATEARVDWHYIGGRVHIKALPAARAPADSGQEDAMRYRWLRRWKGQEHEPPFTVQHELDGTLWGGDLDAAIDAAMADAARAAQKEGEKT